MKDFIQKIINDCKLSPDKYSNTILLNNIYKEAPENLNEIINYYKLCYKQSIEIIVMLFDNLLNKCDSLAYYIKCIC